MYWSVPPSITRFVVLLTDAPIPLLLPVPPLASVLTESVPPVIVVAPVYELAPVRVSVPAPALVRPKLPDTTPPTVRMLALTVTVRLAPRVTAPVPRFSAFEPVKVKSLFQFCTLLVESVTDAPLVLSRVAVLEIVKLPVPMAEDVPPLPLLFMFRVPAAVVLPLLMVVPPE